MLLLALLLGGCIQVVAPPAYHAPEPGAENAATGALLRAMLGAAMDRAEARATAPPAGYAVPPMPPEWPGQGAPKAW